jgi:hypothetical protein
MKTPVHSDRRFRYEPLRPDFMEVAGGLSARTTGGVGTCCGTLVASGTLWGCSFFFFFEKLGISFFFFILISVRNRWLSVD